MNHPSQEELPQQSITSSSEIEPTHFDHLIEEEAQAEEVEERAAVSGQMLTQEEFRKSFFGLHGMAATFSGLKSLELPNSHVSAETGSEIADTIYETILDVPLLHGLLYPNNKWIGRGFMMIVYVQGMRGAIREELQARQPQKPEKSSFSKAKKATSGEGELSPDQLAALTGGMVN